MWYISTIALSQRLTSLWMSSDPGVTPWAEAWLSRSPQALMCDS